MSQMTSFMVYYRVCSMNNTTGATSGAGTAYPSGTLEFTPVFSGVSAARSLVSCIVFCILLFVPLTFFFWPLFCLFFFDLRILITTLVSSNSA